MTFDLFRLFGRLFKRPAKLPVLSRRSREAANSFAGLHARLTRENRLHALMLSQRHFRKIYV